MNQTDHINLVHKQLSGEITQEELTQLNEWIALSEDNEFVVESITLAWDNAAINPEQLEALAADVDMDKEFALLNVRIKSNEETETKVIPMRRRYLSIAAGFALLIGITISAILINNMSSSDLAEISTGDESKEILLADGSTIYLNANSTLKYPEIFDSDTREVEFTGEGFFDIAKDPAHPFIVHTPFEDVTVLGTSFNIRAYENEVNSEVAVSTGKVKVSNGITHVTLLPNEKAIVDHSSGVMDQEKTVALNETAWHTKTIEFSNALVPDVLSDLETYYGIEFSFTNPDLANCHFTSTFVNEDLPTVLVSISTVLNVTINEEGNGKYVLVGGGCQ